MRYFLRGFSARGGCVFGASPRFLCNVGATLAVAQRGQGQALPLQRIEMVSF